MPSLRKQIILAKEEIERAKAIKCTCSSFVYQYEGGCQCERGRQLLKAEAKLNNIITGVK